MNRDKLIEDLFLATEAVQRAWKARFHASLDHEGVTMTQMYALFMLEHYQPISSKKFAGYMKLTPGAVTQIIDSLGNYVERKNNESDRRIVYLQLSKPGTKLLHKLRQKRKTFFVQATQAFSEHELYTMLKEQQKILDQLEKL